ncbi:MAG: membrane protein insertion efficiency factor YidD [Candidatus Hydrogenedentes bacterium]|nr:membrane protein insertion efficiency factor YidD [Candidatus Hydrogenedentota bacterium]
MHRRFTLQRITIQSHEVERNNCCRYHPSCSEYSIEAVEEHGIRWGVMLSIIRLARCASDVPLNMAGPP